MWVFDNDGKWLNGLPPPDSAMWAADPHSATGDRHSTSLISKQHPYLFACFSCDPDSQFKGGLVLAPSRETRSRVMCVVHGDIGTVRHTCAPMGRSETCSPGCGSIRCGAAGGNPRRTWSCSWRTEDLKQMMETHNWGGTGYTGPFVPGLWPYHELVIDSWTRPWDDDLGRMVEAVFVQKRGTPNSKEHGRLVHESLLQRIGATAEALPLVEYDPSAASEPFRPLPS